MALQHTFPPPSPGSLEIIIPGSHGVAVRGEGKQKERFAVCEAASSFKNQKKPQRKRHCGFLPVMFSV